MDAARRRAAMRAAMPLAVAVATFGIAFGILARATGFHPLAAILMSATTFAGSAQFAAVAVLEAGGGVGAAVVAAALLNSRYLPMGVSVGPALAGSPLSRLLRGQLVVDESWAMAQTDRGTDAARLIGVGVVLYAAWVAGTAVGALAATGLADPAALGLDAAFPALFLALLVPTLRDRRAVAVAVVAVVVALALTPLLPPGVPLVAAAGAALAGAWR